MFASISRLPWDQETFIGYIAEIICIVVTDEGYLLTSGSILLLYISMCLHHRAFYEMFRHLLRTREHQNRVKNQLEWIYDVIRFHSSVKWWNALNDSCLTGFACIFDISVGSWIQSMHTVHCSCFNWLQTTCQPLASFFIWNW